MGRSTTCAAVPFKLSGEGLNNIFRRLNTEHEDDIEEWNCPDPLIFSYKKWDWNFNCSTKYKWLYCDELKKTNCFYWW